MHTPEEVEPLSPVSGTDFPGRTSPLKPEIPDGGLKAWSTVAGSHLIPKLGFAQAVRATAWVVVGCLVAANGLMQNNPAVYNLRAQAPPLDVLSFLTDVPYMIGVFGYANQIIVDSFADHKILHCSVLVSLFGCYFPGMTGLT
ncbi:hypothetical protein C0989_009076 [Termitomyces sp. Mn162]|nr:hypothetical protein C0989_009076 [Termitomyces sp. Mn162]